MGEFKNWFCANVFILFVACLHPLALNVMKDVTLISQYFYPEMISTGHVLTELLVELVGRGIRGSAICAQPTYYSAQKVDPLMTYEGLRIIRTKNTQYDKNSLKGKLFNSASFFLMAIPLALNQSRTGPLILVTNPPFLGSIGPILKGLKRRPFLLIIHDVYPDIAIRMGYLRERCPITLIWRLLNLWVFCKASSIVVLGRDVQRVIENRMPLKHRQKVVYIPNWADPSLVQPVEHAANPFVKRLGLEDKFIVQYSGNMGLIHDMETIIETARELHTQDDIQFLLIGGGGKLGGVQKMVRSYGLNNVTLVPYQPRENLKQSLGAAHVSLISLENGIQGLSVPSKLYGIMASGRPAIAIMAEDSEAAMTLKDFKCGLVTPPNDVPALAKAIIWLKANEAERKAMGERAHKGFLENFTVQRCADQYYYLINQLLVSE